MYRPYLSLKPTQSSEAPKKSTLVEVLMSAWGCLSHNAIICSGIVIWLIVFRTGFWLPANSLQWWNRTINTQSCCENTHGVSQIFRYNNNSSVQISHKEIFPECRMRVLYCKKAQEPSAKHIEKKSSEKSPSENSYLIFIYRQTHSYCILGGRNPVAVKRACPAAHLNEFIDSGRIFQWKNPKISVRQSPPFSGSDVILTGYCISKTWKRQNEKIPLKKLLKHNRGHETNYSKLGTPHVPHLTDVI